MIGDMLKFDCSDSIKLTRGAKDGCVISIVSIWAHCSAISIVVVERYFTRFRECVTVRTSEVRRAFTLSPCSKLFQTCPSIQASIRLAEGEVRPTHYTTKTRDTFTHCICTRSFNTRSTVQTCFCLAEWEINFTCSSSKTFRAAAAGSIS